MRIGRFRLAADWGQIAFASAITGWIVWYYFDALAASPNVQNILLIRPATIAAALVYVAILAQAVRIEPAAGRRAEAAPAPSSAPARRPLTHPDFRPPILAALLVLYVLSLQPIGFDIATFLFVAATMLTAGERRPIFVAGFSLVFAGAVTWFFKNVLSVPIDTLLL